MSSELQQPKIALEPLAAQCRSGMIPVTNRFSYFCTMPMAEEDARQYIHDPIAALSPGIASALPAIGILLTPYLEKGNGKHGDLATFDRPAETKSILSAQVQSAGLLVLAFAIKEVEVADYHYQFYNALSRVIAAKWPSDVQEAFFRTLREELSAEMHGEVDEKSWHLKQALLRRQTNVRRETKLFREYAQQAFEDTLTLYLHGTCCDIDVETGPRQMPSRYLRRRLELLMSLYPPPDGYAVLPEQLKGR
jgi:hypothetical protein